MDMITHSLAGLALGTLSGEPISLTNPIYLSAMLGAVAPDIDVLWGYRKFKRRRDLPKWLQHRAITHSLVGMPILAGSIALGLHLIFPQTSFWLLFLFSLIGAFSHSLLDLMNCYGVNILWPIKKKAYSLNIIPLIDPVLVTFFLLMIGSVNFINSLPPALLLTSVMYIGLRWVFFARARNAMSLHYAVAPDAIQMIPPPISLTKWDFSIEEEEDISGQVKCFPRFSVMEENREN
ncbi:metal-dependent hydrolase [Desulfitibacter alkalitolerans]|uniref:metal-dependent hydrolase n=1 Tax=Desulfitibacter alkalitolerans TaxID=264641 RepID=UPI00068720C0|nr:metal-dependent hydrolase [Desulfitibacter alkalitolerans]